MAHIYSFALGRRSPTCAAPQIAAAPGSRHHHRARAAPLVLEREQREGDEVRWWMACKCTVGTWYARSLCVLATRYLNDLIVISVGTE